MKKIIFIFTLIMFSLYCLPQNSLKKLLETYNVKTEQACNAKNGYWYKSKCWANFKDIDPGISNENIDKEVKKQLNLINGTKIGINGNKYPIIVFYPKDDREEIILITVFTRNNSQNTLLQRVNRNILQQKKVFTTDAVMFGGNIMELSGNDAKKKITMKHDIKGRFYGKVNDFKNFNFDFRGEMINTKTKVKYSIEFSTNEAITGAGYSTLEIVGNKAFLNGDLGTVTYPQIKNLINNHPTVKTLVFGKISGSVNDAVNMHTGRLIREAGLTTKVLKNSVIASGGVDLFCAGKTRIVTKGAKIGVHSWDSGEFEGIDLPKDHPAHKYQIEYFSMCLGKKGTDFYFYTLTAAPAGGIHWMSEKEIIQWDVATKIKK